MQIAITPARIMRGFFSVWGLLFVLNCIAGVFKVGLHQSSVMGFVPMFNFDDERNAPTMFSSTLIISAATLFWVVSDYQKSTTGQKNPWKVFSWILVYIALDEFSQIHEHLIGFFHDKFHTSGFFHYGWVIPFGLALIPLACTTFPALWKLPKNTRCRICLAASIYVFGALVMEMLGGKYAEVYGVENPIYYIMTTVEESCEFIGMMTLIWALLDFLAAAQGVLLVKLSPSQQQEVATAIRLQVKTPGKSTVLPEQAS